MPEIYNADPGFANRPANPTKSVLRSASTSLNARLGCPAVSQSEPFEDGLAFLRVAEERGLEGVVRKRRDAPYRSGECRDWRKVKMLEWREANKKRWRLSERG